MKKTNFTPFYHPNCLQGGLKETSTNVMLFRQRKDQTLSIIAEEGLEKPGQKCIFFNKMIMKINKIGFIYHLLFAFRYNFNFNR